MGKASVGNDKKIVGSPTVHRIGMFVVLFAFWLGLAGRTDVKTIIYGLVACSVTSWITYPLLLIDGKGGKKYFIFGVSLPRLFLYALWLLWQLVLANVDVALATVGQKLAIDPKIVRFYFRTENPMAAVVLADSITLTPGTVTINVSDDGLYEIHALTPGAAAGIRDGGMQRKVAELYGEKLYFSLVDDEEEA